MVGNNLFSNGQHSFVTLTNIIVDCRAVDACTLERENQLYKYKMNEHTLEEVELEKDLGVIVDKDFHKHSSFAIRKGKHHPLFNKQIFWQPNVFKGIQGYGTTSSPRWKCSVGSTR